MKLTIFSTLLLLLANVASADDELKILNIHPIGEDVPAARQIVIQFNHEVVPIGRMERSREEIPISLSPQLDCQWRWLDRSSLACQLGDKEAMRPATRYSVTVWPGIKDQNNITLSQPFVHQFITERPRVSYVRFKTWRAPGHPVIVASFNQPVDKESLRQHLYFQLPDNQRIAVQVEPDPNNIGDSQYEADAKARRVWLLQPVTELPLDSSIKLNGEPGLKSALGPETSVENKTVLAFDTYPEFRFNGIVCHDNHDKKLLITDSKTKGKCNPLASIGLSFSTPVLNSEVKNKLLITPDLAGDRKDYDPWANTQDYSRLHWPHKLGRSYEIWLSENLQAAQRYVINTKENQALIDEFGRKPPKPVAIAFDTDHRKPDFTRAYRHSVLEQQIDSELPLYVTNLNKIRLNYQTLTSQGGQTDRTLQLDVPKAEDVSFAIPMQVRKMLNGKSGAVYGDIGASPRLKKGSDERVFFSQVTPYAMHVKLGHFNTLVWVTDLATGEPVSEANVSVHVNALAELAHEKPAFVQATTDNEGIALLPGTDKLDPMLATFDWRCRKDSCYRLHVKVEKDGQIALLPLENAFEIDSYRASNYSVYASPQKQFGHIRAWGATAQGVYRAGDTMQFKLYVRNQDAKSFVPAPRQGYQLEIIAPTGKTVHTIDDLELSEFGAYHGEYKIPKSATIGWYSFRLKAAFTKYSWRPIRVLVSDFTPSPFKVDNELNGDLFHTGDELQIQTLAKLHSGGAYTNAQARITVDLKAGYFASAHPVAKGFHFDTYRGQNSRQLLQQFQALNDKGEAQVKTVLPESDIIYGRLRIESSVQDDRGKYIAALASADYFAVDRLVGLKSSQWLFHEDEPAAIDYLVVDAQGNPTANTNVELEIQREETVAARVKGAGNAYLTQFSSRWVKTGECRGVSTTKPSSCEFVPNEPGSYKIIAAIEDSKGKAHRTEFHVWVAGKGRVLWRQPDDNSLPIIPEKTDYKVGDTARYLIKNPYPGAQALITLERYGVIKQWRQRLAGSTPVIEFKIDEDLLPGFYLSVVVMSPRVDKPLQEGKLDLGKPAFKIGYLKVPVADPWKQIDVKINTDADIYKPGDRVKAQLQANIAHPSGDEPIELAVAVLDEAVLDLIAGGKAYFDPYQGFYELDALDVKNFGLLSRLLGRQKFEKKGANSGGDGGGALSMRSLFKYVSYWNPSIKTDSDGKADIEFDLPDNLTGWRILALAVTPSDRMGLGDAGFKVNQPTEIRPVMPNQVTEGDRFQAGFSIMNRTGRERTLTIEIGAEGNLTEPLSKTEELTLAPYKRQTVYIAVQSSPIKQNRDIDRGDIRFTVKAYDKRDGDALRHHVPVLKRRSLVTTANYGGTSSAKAQEIILVPKQAYADVGDIGVELSPSVIGNVAGAFRYLRDYPYACWEQKLSKGVMASHFKRLEAYLPDDLDWPESAGLPGKMLAQAADYQAPNGGMVYYIAQDRYVSPYLSAYTALAFNWLRDAGYEVPIQVEQKLHGYLKTLLRKNVLPDFYSKGMASSVRAVALAALSRQGKISLADLQRYRAHVPYMSLFGKAHYLQAAQSLTGSDDIVKQVRDIIMNHAQQSGGKFSFNEQLDDGYSRMLATPLRANCAILSALSSTQTEDDTPFKLVRSITQSRGKRDHWENTQENLFCMNALIDYSNRYENEKPAMNIEVTVDNAPLGKAAFDDLRDQAETLSLPLTGDMLGKQQTVSITKTGTGRLYHTTRLAYAPLDESAERINAGLDIRREYSVERNGQWILLDSNDPYAARNAQIQRGELVRVDLYLSLPTARNFVVVADPVPGGLEPVNRDLATTSAVDADKGDRPMAGGAWWFQFSDWITYNASRWSFYHREIKHDTVRFYSDYLPAGNYHLSYTAQAIASGAFARQPTHAEEMYDPDIFGKSRPGRLIVEE